MYPFLFSILGRDIPAYGLMIILGVGAGAGLVALLCGPKRKNRIINRTDALLAGCIAFAGALIGAIFLRPLMKLPEVIIQWEVYSQYTIADLFNYLFGELVFYGGLIGGSVAAFIYCRGFKTPILPVLDVIAAALPLGHAFGRVGCLLAGCCYGIKVGHDHPFAIIYPPESLAAPHGVPLLAVPLIEAATLLIISAILVVVYITTRRKGLCVGIYLSLYAIDRFVLEFFRGDIHRGYYGPLSTSQYISIGIFIAGFLFLAFAALSKKARTVTEPEINTDE